MTPESEEAAGESPKTVPKSGCKPCGRRTRELGEAMTGHRDLSVRGHHGAPGSNHMSGPSLLAAALAVAGGALALGTLTFRRRFGLVSILAWVALYAVFVVYVTIAG